jgi:hypothetical protein
MTKRPIYCTTFCNFAHYVDTGRPIDHECYVLRPIDIRAEMDAKDGDDMSELYRVKGPVVVGRPMKES